MLSGNLAEFPFPSLVGALMQAGRTGRLFLRTPFLEAEVYLRGGQPLHARVQAGGRALEGEEALDLLAGLRRASFTFEPEVLPPHTTLLGGLAVPARLAEAQAAWEKLNLPPDWGYVLRLGPGGGEVELPPEALGVLAQVEGRRIAEVLLAPGPLRLACVLNTLLGLGVAWGSSRPSPSWPFPPSPFWSFPSTARERGSPTWTSPFTQGGPGPSATGSA
jgi:hypothetical protein